MERVQFDSVEGIRTSLLTLSSLHEMLQARRQATRMKTGENGRVQLNEFVLLGRYWLDQFGQCSKAAGVIPKDRFPGMPDVMEYKQYLAFLASNTPEEDKYKFGWAFDGSQNIAPPDMSCKICGQFWSVSNCHDITSERESVFFPLQSFIGKPVGELVEHLRGLHDARYQYHYKNDPSLRNDRFIDLTQEAVGKSGITTPVNPRGWVKLDTLGEEKYVIQSGDEIPVDRTYYFHKVCHLNSLAAETEAEFRTVMHQAGFKYLRFWKIKNEYGSESYRGPWFEIYTDLGKLMLGWNKRIINVDWSATGKKFLHLFEDIKNTKGEGCIHAYGYTEALDFLTRIRKELERGQKELISV